MNNERIEEIEEKLSELIERKEFIESDQGEEEFKDFLNESYQAYEVMGLVFSAGDVISELDNITFREAYNNHYDNELSETQEEIKALEEELKELKGE